MRANEISKLLSKYVQTVCELLLPNGKLIGDEYEVGSISGEKGKSLKVHVVGNKAGTWKDFATDEKGDLIGLWTKVKKISLYEAISEASSFLGISQKTISIQNNKKYIKPQIEFDVPSAESVQFEYLIKDRLITLDTIKKFKIRYKNNTLIFRYFYNDEVLFVKYLSLKRENGKKVMWVEKDTQPCLFGWQAIPTDKREIIICEGEIDAMTISQFGYPALSVPLGGGVGDKHSWIEFEFDKISVFDQIYLCFDNDEVGEKSIKYISERIGRHKCKIIKLPYKDANEALQNGMTKEEFSSFVKYSKTIDPDELVFIDSIIDEGIETAYPSEESLAVFKMPFKKYQNLMSFRQSEISIWCGINGHGKSQFLGQLMTDYLNEGCKICVASLELTNGIFILKLFRQISGKKLPSENHMRKISETYKDKLCIYNQTKTSNVDNMIEVFKYANQRYDIKVFFIDSFMKLDVYDEDYKGQKICMDKLCDFKNNYKCHIHLVTHPRKSLDEYEIPTKLSVKGSGAITDLVDNVFIVARNKKKHEQMYEYYERCAQPPRDLIEKHDAKIICCKQRTTGQEFVMYLWFDQESGQFLESYNSKPKIYVGE